ncbi:MAG: sulfatase [Planctomycetota bacterium]
MIGCRESTTAAMQRHNVLLIVIDTLRADHLSSYAYARPTSRAIDALAARGVRFANAFATISYTIPSHASLFTSAYPSFHGVGTRNGGSKLHVDQPTLAWVFQQAGYETAAFMSNPILRADCGLDKGFDRYAADALVDAAGQPRERRASETAAAACQWLRGKHAAPFFLWVHLQDPHGAYVPPAPIKGTFHSPPTGKSLPIAADADGYQQIPRYQRLGNESDPAYYLDRYDEEIVYADQAVGTILQELAAQHLDERTIVVLTADHGEALGEDDYYFCHGFTLGLEQIHVPLVFAVPGTAPRVMQDVVSLVDVMPTLLELTGLTIGEPLAGESLAPALAGRPLRPSRTVFAESLNQEAVVRYPFIVYRDRKDAADLTFHRAAKGKVRAMGVRWKALPGARVGGEPPLAELQQTLDDFARMRARSKRARNDIAESKELLETLKALGYAR